MKEFAKTMGKIAAWAVAFAGIGWGWAACTGKAPESLLVYVMFGLWLGTKLGEENSRK